MATPNRSKSAKKSKISFIPVVFTLGVIGWGFLAIDRLIPPASQGHSLANVPQEKRQNVNEGWKVALGNWFQNFLGTSNNNEKNSTAGRQKNQKAVPQNNVENDLEIIDEKSLPNWNSQPDEKNANAPANSRGVIYVYKSGADGFPVLVALPQDFQSKDTLSQIRQTFTSVLDFGEKHEAAGEYFNSFPVKPKIKSVKKVKDTLVLNFNHHFGEGASLQLLRYQIKQLLATAMQFSGVKNIQIQIDGKNVREIGGDGIVIPDKINQGNLI